MMRLTESGRNARRVTLAVEGWIAGEDAGLLQAECSAHLEQGLRVDLDLSAVSYVDAAGARTLRRLRRNQLEIVSCPPFILEFVDGSGPGRTGGQ